MLSLIVPVFNEEEAIEPTVRSLHRILSGQTMPWEILVIDDGSTDATARILAGFSLPGVTVITHPQNLGNGAAIKTGISRSTGDILATVDADGTYPLEDFPRLLREMTDTGADMIVGARPANAAHIPLIQQMAKAVLIGLAQYLTECRIPDLNSGMRIFRRTLAERFLHLYPQRFSFHITITLGALVNGFLVRFPAITYNPRIGKSKLTAGVGGVTNFLRFCHIILRIVSYFRPLRFFLWPAGILLACGLALMASTTLGAGSAMLVWGAALLLASFQVGLCGVLAELTVRMRQAR